MANYVKGCTIAFEQNDTVVDMDIVEFFSKIENAMRNEPKNIVRKINGKIIRVHAYEWDYMNENFVVVPFGKLKEKNKPYGMDEKTQALEDIPQKMYDVNNFAYHSGYKIAVVTTNQQSPSVNDIECYLNSFLPKESEYNIRIRPVKRNNGIEEIRNATQARNVSFVLDLGRPMNDFFKTEVKTKLGAGKALKELMETSKNELESKTFKISLGLGRKRKETLNIEYLLEMLESINIDSTCVKEIYVEYRNGTSDKIDKARLKEAEVILTLYFDIKDNQISSEYLKANLEQKLLKERKKYYRQVDDYYSNMITVKEDYDFIEEWTEEEDGDIKKISKE